MAAFQDFITKVSTDKELEAKFKALIQDTTVEDKKQALLEFAKEIGIELTIADVEEYVKANTEEGELSDEQLDVVAGGTGFWTGFAQGFCSVLASLGFCFWT